MPNQQITDLISSRLSDLVHPGDEQTPATVLPLPMFRQQMLQPDMAEHFAKEAGFPRADVNRLVAEAIVSLIENDGESEIVPKPELTKLRSEYKPVDPYHIVTVTCRLCGSPIITKMAVDIRDAMVDGVRFLTALRTMNSACPHDKVSG